MRRGRRAKRLRKPTGKSIIVYQNHAGSSVQGVQDGQVINQFTNDEGAPIAKRKRYIKL